MASAKIYRGIIIANAFSFFISAGQACLIPFLSLYFLYLDLSPLQTGLLLGVKALTAALSSAFWTQCVATTARRLKFVLVFSLLMLILSHLVMVLMPSMDSGKSMSFCKNYPIPSPSNETFVNCSDVANDTNCSAMTSVLFTPDWTTPITNASSVNNNKTDEEYPTRTGSTAISKPWSTHNLTKISATSSTSRTSVPSNTEEFNHKSPDRKITIATTSQKETSNHNSPNLVNDLEDYWAKDDTDYNYGRRRRLVKKHVHPFEHMTSTTTMLTMASLPQSHSQNPDGLGSTTTTESPNLVTTPDALEQRLNDIQDQVFSAMLVLVVVSEMFSSPSEPVAEELYVSFLEYNDQSLVRRRTTSCWALLSGSITPWVVVMTIDRLPCHVPPLGSHRILFHFWIFALIHSLTFLFSVCYPSSFVSPAGGSRSPTSSTSPRRGHHHLSKRWANLSRGMKLIASDGRAVLATATIFIVGITQGFISTFLPWAIHGLATDGSEFYIGAAIGLAAIGDLIAKLFGDWICRKIGHAVTIFFGLLVIGTRLAIYGFMTEPWLALIGESAHAFGGAMVASSVADHPAFKFTVKGSDGENGNGGSKKQMHSRGYGSIASFSVGESMSVQSALRFVRTGFGFSIGCCVAGILSARYHMSLAFLVASGTSVVWCLIFALLYPCCKSRCAKSNDNSRKRRSTGLASSLFAGRYKKISRRDDDDDEDEDEDDYDDDDEASSEEERGDWLDTMMRKHKS